MELAVSSLHLRFSAKEGRDLLVQWWKSGFTSHFSTAALQPLGAHPDGLWASTSHPQKDLGPPASFEGIVGKQTSSKIAEGFKNIRDIGADCTFSWISNEGLPGAFQLVNKSRIDDLRPCHFVTRYFRHQSQEALLGLHDFLFSTGCTDRISLSHLVISQEPWLLLFSS